MTRRILLPLLTLILLQSLIPLAFADTQPILRKILGLYDSNIYHDPFYSPTHQSIEMPLNYLGLEVVYRPSNLPLPSVGEMKDFRGIVTWFPKINSVPDPGGYCHWLKEQMNNGKKIVILEEPGIFADKKRKMLPECKAAFKTLGVIYGNNWGDNPYFMEIAKKDSTMVEFERKLDLNEGLQYLLFKPTSPQTKVYLSMKRTDDTNSESAVIFTSPQGGMAAPTFVNYQNEPLGKIHWRLNPFLFFEEAFGTKGLPRPDVTTMEGRRIFFSQIDGDGIFNVSHIDQESFSGEVIDKEILKKYSNVPITISLIAGYLDQSEFKSPRAMRLYQTLLNESNCEVGSHGYAHPLVWRTGKVALQIPGYKYSAEKEIRGSIEMINALSKSFNLSKTVSLFQWTGDSIPAGGDIRIANQAGVENLNGGGSRFDKKFDSLSFVFPIGILKENYRQIYAGAGNENDYTNLWKGPYYGFSDILETFDKLESPRRLKPIDIYYHFYSGERAASLDSLKKVYDTVLSENIFPVTTSHYAKIATDFFSTHLSMLPGGFRVTDNGAMKTIRFDREARNIDLTRSTGVHGFNHFQGSLYVFLDDSNSHNIFLTNQKPTRPWVINASFEVARFTGNSSHLSFSKKGWNKSEEVLGGMLPRQKYKISVASEETFSAESDGTGQLSLSFSKSENNGPAVFVEIRKE